MGTSWTVLSYYVRIICEGLTLIGSIAYLIGATKEARFQGTRAFFKNLVSFYIFFYLYNVTSRPIVNIYT